jgi:hypothetical protein
MTDTDASVDAIRLAWGIGISDAEADSAASVIESRKLLHPGMPESYWIRALRNLMLDYARHSRVRKHAVMTILYPRRTGQRNYVEDAMIAAIDAQRRGNPRRQEIQVENILAKIVKTAGQIDHVNTSGLPHDAFIERLQAHKKIPALRLRTKLRFTDPCRQRTLLTVQVSSYFSWPSYHHDWPMKRSAISLDVSAEITALPEMIHCYLEKDPIPDSAIILEL